MGWMPFQRVNWVPNEVCLKRTKGEARGIELTPVVSLRLYIRQTKGKDRQNETGVPILLLRVPDYVYVKSKWRLCPDEPSRMCVRSKGVHFRSGHTSPE